MKVCWIRACAPCNSAEIPREVFEAVRFDEKQWACMLKPAMQEDHEEVPEVLWV